MTRLSSEKILVVGGGGREHALAWHLKKSGFDVNCAPGNDGISKSIPCWNFKDFDELAQRIQEEGISQVIVGPEKYLAEGIADFLTEKKIECFGPTKEAAQLESDKAFAKDFCIRHKIPQARTVSVSHSEDLRKALSNFESPYVVKASGLAAGKGVWIGSDLNEAVSFGTEALKQHKSLVIEEFLKGEEISYFAMVDGKNYALLGAAQDHKRLLENDLGPNTGGMGAYSPVPILNSDLEKKIIEEILERTIEGLQADKMTYRGFLFLGVMVVNSKPYLLEYNCRMGDPETQVIMLRLESSLPELMSNLKKTSGLRAKLDSRVALNVVIAGKGYPDEPKQGFPLIGIDEPPRGIQIFYSGVKQKGSHLIAAGGRIFSVNSLQTSLLECQSAVYPWIEGFNFQKDICFRRDIAVKAYTHLWGVA